MNGDSINLVQPRQKPVHDYNKALIDFLSQAITIISVENYQGFFCPKLRRQFDAGTPIFWFVFFHMPLQLCIYINTIHTFARKKKLHLIRQLATSFRLDS